MRLILITVCSAAFAAGSQGSPAAAGAFTQATPSAPLVHSSSGFSFPSQIGSFQRERATQYDSAGEDISVGYNNPAIPIAATVYVYPARARPLAEEFASRQAEVMHGHIGAQLLSTATAAVTPRQSSALAAAYTFRGLFAGKTQLLRSELLVAQQGERFVEYRFTYPDTEQTSARTEVDSFERTFSWPP
jgi:hypothetical protein